MSRLITSLEFIEGFNKRDYSYLSRAITYVESLKKEHNEIAREVLAHFAPQNKTSLRLGITGTPGVGKSTFIENFGNLIISKNKTVAVLAIDPSSHVTGGSILGDKTRMTTLSSSPHAFIRPSPSGNELGGVANKTREALLLCEAFGFDYILIETVGVGQSEISVSKFIDFYLFLMQPGGGDDLQGIKRGILELVNLVAVNKADGELLNKAHIAKTELKMALGILRKGDPRFCQDIFLTSSVLKSGFGEIYEYLEKEFLNLISTKKLKELREAQNKTWFDELAEKLLLKEFLTHPEIIKLKDKEFKEVTLFKKTIFEAAEVLLDKYKGLLKSES